jgi:ketosteroid isomerase-like protein
MFLSLIIAIVIAIVVTGCAGGTPTPSGPKIAPQPTRVRTPTPVPANDEEAIKQLILAEAEGVVQQDIDRLMDIWDPNGVVTDANHTPDDTRDDTVWVGQAQIRDRYVNMVFPSAPAENKPADIKVTLAGDKATAISSTHIGITNAPANDRWEFVKKNNVWKIRSLTYGLAPK